MSEEEDDYGMEEEDEEFDDAQEDDIFDKKKGGKSDKKGKQKASIYADYEEFANLLEEDMYNEDKAKKYLPNLAGKKRGRNQGGRSNNHHRGKKRQRTK